MSSINEHCEASMRTFGKYYWVFHYMLDWYAGKEGHDFEGYFNYKDVSGEEPRKYKHVEKLHNNWYIGEIRKRYGGGPADALEQHVKQDFRNHEIFRNKVPDKGDPRVFWRSLIIWTPPTPCDYNSIEFSKRKKGF